MLVQAPFPPPAPSAGELSARHGRAADPGVHGNPQPAEHKDRVLLSSPPRTLGTACLFPHRLCPQLHGQGCVLQAWAARSSRQVAVFHLPPLRSWRPGSGLHALLPALRSKTGEPKSLPGFSFFLLKGQGQLLQEKRQRGGRCASEMLTDPRPELGPQFPGFNAYRSPTADHPSESVPRRSTTRT